MKGRRIHITGSAAPTGGEELLQAANAYVRVLVEQIIARGGGLVLGAGPEPVDESGQPCIFDWTALEAVASAPDPAPERPNLRPDRFVVVASQRGVQKIPDSRRVIWDQCRTRSDFDVDVAPPGWRMAGIIREHQVLRGDVLLALGGGAGAEHLAELYAEEGKPIVPIYAELAALNEDGNGGSKFLHERALSGSDRFFRLRDGSGSAVGRLSGFRLSAKGDTEILARETADLLDDLRPPRAFYVRLLANETESGEVEQFFRDIVDAVVVERGYTPYEMGQGGAESAFMNVEIFERLHRAGLVIVDLTGVRPNCTMELGYALGRRRRIVISAKKGTRLPFDEDKLPTYFWENEGTRAERTKNYRDWFDRHIELPPIVESRHLY